MARDDDRMGQLAAQDAYEQQAVQDAFAAFAARTGRPQRSVEGQGIGAGIGSLFEKLAAVPSWTSRAAGQAEQDKAAFQAGGVKALTANMGELADLAGGFGGTTKGWGSKMPVARTGGEMAKLTIPDTWVLKPGQKIGMFSSDPTYLIGGNLSINAKRVNDVLAALERQGASQAQLSDPEFVRHVILQNTTSGKSMPRDAPPPNIPDMPLQEVERVVPPWETPPRKPRK